MNLEVNGTQGWEKKLRRDVEEVMKASSESEQSNPKAWLDDLRTVIEGAVDLANTVEAFCSDGEKIRDPDDQAAEAMLIKAKVFRITAQEFARKKSPL